VFKKDVLASLLDSSKAGSKFLDFGGEIIPYAAQKGLRVQAYGFDDYWEDIGTIKSFFEENLKLARTDAPFEFYGERRCARGGGGFGGLGWRLAAAGCGCNRGLPKGGRVRAHGTRHK
jgi:NDP-sugar pyrophosphorylase family protein